MSNIKFSSGVDVYTTMHRFTFWVNGMLIWDVEMMRLASVKSGMNARILSY
jgi:hypothetical protein